MILWHVYVAYLVSGAVLLCLYWVFRRFGAPRWVAFGLAWLLVVLVSVFVQFGLGVSYV